MIEATVLEMLKKNRPEEQIIGGLQKLGYSKKHIEEAIISAKKTLKDEEPESIIGMGRLFRKHEEHHTLKSHEIGVRDKDHLKPEHKESHSWILPVIALIIIVWLVVFIVMSFGESSGLREWISNSLSKQADSEFYTYCTSHLNGYSENDKTFLCEELDKKDPIELRYTNMNDACRRLSFDNNIVRPCALQLTQLVDAFNAATS